MASLKSLRLESKFCIICTAIPDEKAAEEIAARIVEKRLAACANTFPVKSVFHWKGKLERTTEFAVFLKTRAALAGRCEAEIKKLHPYELPEIIRIPIKGGSGEYLKWIRDETAKRYSDNI